ncbi:MAG: T9SS type A sorting domain-containing protein [Bacteroidales bacterium]|jgi:sugar lactone lactonase YvrE|nr:T9SS type A sorting domain-containing protein [Bacteroidales bacterium]
MNIKLKIPGIIAGRKAMSIVLFVLFSVVVLRLQAQTNRQWENHALPVPYDNGTYIYGIDFDKFGNAWMATDAIGAGAWKYDKQTWTKFAALPHDHDDDDDDDHLNSIAADHNSIVTIDDFGNIWFGSNGHGVSKLMDTLWRTYNTSNGLSHGMIRDILTIKDTVWMATMNGLNRLTDDTVCTVYRKQDGLADSSVTCLAVDLSGMLWVGTSRGLSKFDGISSWRTYYPLSGTISNNYIDAIAIDREGNIWIAIYRSGIWMYDGTTWTKKYDHIYINTITFDKDGHLWASSTERGLDVGGVFEFDGNVWTHYTQEDGLFDNRVASIAVDMDGNIWIGCYGGLSILSYTSGGVRMWDRKQEEGIIRLYPNPADAQFTLTHVAGAEIHLCTTSGQTIRKVSATDENMVIDAGSLPQGVYLLKIIKNNTEIIRKIQVLH